MDGNSQYMRKADAAEPYLPYRDGETEEQWRQRLAAKKSRSGYERAGRTPEEAFRQDIKKGLLDGLRRTTEK